MLRVFDPQRGADTEETLSARMGRAQDTAVEMDDFYEKSQGQSPELQNRNIYAGRHNDEYVARVYGVIFDAFEYDKIFGFFF